MAEHHPLSFHPFGWPPVAYLQAWNLIIFPLIYKGYDRLYQKRVKVTQESQWLLFSTILGTRTVDAPIQTERERTLQIFNDSHVRSLTAQ